MAKALKFEAEYEIKLEAGVTRKWTADLASLQLEHLRECWSSASWVHNILTTLMTHIVVVKSTDNAKPRSIC